MKQIATVKVGQLAARYGEQAPMATACCNACRTCVQTNLLAIALAAVAASGASLAQAARRLAGPRSVGRVRQ